MVALKELSTWCVSKHSNDVEYGVTLNIIFFQLRQLEQQPRWAKFVSLHFDRLPTERNSPPMLTMSSSARRIKVVSQGAWSSKGKRESQEDSFGKKH